jgi:predicted lipoprotein with Yx(FWY)xxD motif
VVLRLRRRPVVALVSFLSLLAVAAFAVACGSSSSSGYPASTAAAATTAPTASAATTSGAMTASPGAAAASTPAKPTIGVQTQGAHAPYLVGPNGHTLYVFAHDSSNKSTCTGACQQNWPPLLLSGSEKASAVPAATGTLDVIDRPGTGRQVTYNGWPLYYFQADAAPGDTKGDGVQGLWKVATPGLAAAH